MYLSAANTHTLSFDGGFIFILSQRRSLSIGRVVCVQSDVQLHKQPAHLTNSSDWIKNEKTQKKTKKKKERG